MLRAIVCRMRDIFSIRTPPKSSVSGEPGGVTPRGMRGGDLLVRFADVGANVFDRDAAAGAGGPNAAEIDAQLPGEAAHGGAGRGRGVAVAGHVVDVVVGRRGFLALAFVAAARGLGSSSSSVLGFVLLAVSSAAALAARFFFERRRRPASASASCFLLFGFFRLGLLSASWRGLAFSSLGGCGFLASAALSSAAGRFDLHDRRADFDRVAFADEDLGDLAGLRAGDRHRGLVGLDFEQILIRFDDVAFADKDRQHVAGFDIFAEVGKLDLSGHSYELSEVLTTEAQRHGEDRSSRNMN